MTLAESSYSGSGQYSAQRTTHVVLTGADVTAEPAPGTLADALAMLSSLREENEQLRGALQSNRQIGAAIGILMAQHRLTENEAFDRLRQTSQHRHRKLHDVAGDVLLTGTLPPITTVRVANSDGSR